MSSKTEIISEWVHNYTASLYNWAYSRTQHHETSEDLVQEVFQAAFEYFDKFENRSNPKTWLISILNNKIADYYRKSFHVSDNTVSFDSGQFFNQLGEWKAEAQPSKWSVQEENLTDNSEFQIILKNCMKKLPSSWFAAIQYKYFAEKGSEEICQELGISASNYWQLIHRAKLILRQCIEKNWFKD